MVVLKDKANPFVAELSKLLLLQGEGIDGIQFYRAGRGWLKRTQNLQQRTLSAAAWAEHGDALAGLNGKADVTQHRQGFGTCGVFLREVSDRESCHIICLAGRAVLIELV